MSEWVLLHNTVVRVADVCRIDMISGPSCIEFKIILRIGEPIRIYAGQTGADWCLKIMEEGKKTSIAASKEFDGDDDASEFSE